MHPSSHPASLLVAALVMLRQPCARNRSAARLLLERAAEHAGLTRAEREACIKLADDLEIERQEPAELRAHWLPSHPVADLSVEPGSHPHMLASFTPDLKGVSA